ncbi:MAG TPA: phosphate signaling complex protein PhoU [bacterium]|jgi:phosphate transport system protein
MSNSGEMAKDLKHTHSEYESEIKYLTERLLLMTGRVEQMIADSIKSLLDRDKNLAKKVIDADRKVDVDEIEIDEHCIIMLAKRQPMASDLRYICLAMKVVTSLERVADLATNICERSLELSDLPQLKPYDDIPRMGRLVEEMLGEVISAMMERDAEKAVKVIEVDDQIDELYHQTMRELFALMRNDENVIDQGIRIQNVAKYVERMGDNVTNIAEHVVYMVKGKDIRHQVDEEIKLPD